MFVSILPIWGKKTHLKGCTISHTKCLKPTIVKFFLKVELTIWIHICIVTMVRYSFLKNTTIPEIVPEALKDAIKHFHLALNSYKSKTIKSMKNLWQTIVLTSLKYWLSWKIRFSLTKQSEVVALKNLPAENIKT